MENLRQIGGIFMAKKYSPSGYYIITIDSSHVDDDGYLIIESEDEKLLYNILSGKVPYKPILLTDTISTLSGFATLNGVTLNLFSIAFDDGDVDGYTVLKFYYHSDDDKIAVTYQEY